MRSLALGDWLLPKPWVESHTPYNHHQLSHNHFHKYALNLQNHHIHHQLYICTMFWDTTIHTGSNKSPKSSDTTHAHSSFFPQFPFTALYCQQWLFLCSAVHISRNLLRRQWFNYMKFNPQPPDDRKEVPLPLREYRQEIKWTSHVSFATIFKTTEYITTKTYNICWQHYLWNFSIILMLRE